MQELAELYGAELDQPGLDPDEPWPEVFDRYPELVEGPYGLRALLTYATAPADVAQVLGLRSRRVVPEGIALKQCMKGYPAWRSSYLLKNLRNIFTVVGWLEQERGVDWTTHDLSEMLTEEHLTAFHRAAIVKKVVARSTALSIFQLLGRLASPWAHWIALGAGDEEAAVHFGRLALMLNGPNGLDGRLSWVDSIADEMPKKDPKAKARKVEAAWTRKGQVADFAHDQMVRVRNTFLKAVEDRWGPIDEQLEAPPGGGEWARWIRDLTYWQDQLVLPLRNRTVRLLYLEDRKALGEHVWAEIPDWKIKTKSNSKAINFRPNLQVKDGGVYDDRVRRLYEFHARPRLGGGENPTDFYYVTGNGTPIGSDQAISKRMKACVRNALQFDPDCLGGLTFEEVEPMLWGHSCRHAYGTKMVRLRYIQEAAHQLCHSVQMLLRIYSAEDETTYDPSDLLS